MKKGEESFSYGRRIYECLLGERKRERWLKRKTKTLKNEEELKKKQQNSNNNKEQESQRQKKRLRACLHGGGGPQVGEVTRFGG